MSHALSLMFSKFHNEDANKDCRSCLKFGKCGNTFQIANKWQYLSNVYFQNIIHFPGEVPHNMSMEQLPYILGPKAGLRDQ